MPTKPEKSVRGTEHESPESDVLGSTCSNPVGMRTRAADGPHARQGYLPVPFLPLSISQVLFECEAIGSPNSNAFLRIEARALKRSESEGSYQEGLFLSRRQHLD